MSSNILKVSCLGCNWASQDDEEIQSANHYGECLDVCNGSPALLRWDYADGNIRVSNTSTGDYVDLQIPKEGA